MARATSTTPSSELIAAGRRSIGRGLPRGPLVGFDVRFFHSMMPCGACRRISRIELSLFSQDVGDPITRLLEGGHLCRGRGFQLEELIPARVQRLDLPDLHGLDLRSTDRSSRLMGPTGAFAREAESESLAGELVSLAGRTRADRVARLCLPIGPDTFAGRPERRGSAQRDGSRCRELLQM